MRNALPDTGLVLVAGSSGMGKSTTAAALAALCHQDASQALVVAEPLERSLPGDPVRILERRIPEDTPSVARALGDAMRLEAHLLLVDVPRPETVVTELLALSGQGRLVIATWTAPDALAAVEAFMDALPAGLDPMERTRRGRGLRCVVGARLVPARNCGVLPIFEVLQVNQMLLYSICQGRFGPRGGVGGEELLALTFEASLSSLQSRGLI